jgi:hypothetical protein
MKMEVWLHADTGRTACEACLEGGAAEPLSVAEPLVESCGRSVLRIQAQNDSAKNQPQNEVAQGAPRSPAVSLCTYTRTKLCIRSPAHQSPSKSRPAFARVSVEAGRSTASENLGNYQFRGIQRNTRENGRQNSKQT